MPRPGSQYVFLSALTILLECGLLQAAQQKVDFARDIEPIFRQSCYPCHGPLKQSNGLRLDDRRSALASGDILAGKGTESPLYQRLAGIGDREPMPFHAPPLPSEQIDLIREWIDLGAVWPEIGGQPTAPAQKHWAYVAPRRPDPPRVRNTGWTRNPIDNFVLARLESESLAPAPEASREKLIRRLSLDLIGLPPTIAEIDAFVRDTGPDAYEKVVDRLLASPHYGERWSIPWLDLARYADTNGYEKDNRRSIWPYRDWVIDALNKDMPFDEFTVKQIAGDLLPNANVEQKIATGFQRNTLINEEGGIDPEEYRVAAIIDRTNTTASVWLGSTLGCAQCHDHKFDPFTQEDYYRFFAFFNSTEEEVESLPGSERRSRGPNLSVPAPRAYEAQRARVEEEIASLETTLHSRTPELDRDRIQWEREAKTHLIPWAALCPTRAFSVSGAGLNRRDDDSILVSGKSADQDAYLLIADTQVVQISGIRLEALADPSLPDGGVSRGPSGEFNLTGFHVEAKPVASDLDFETIRLLDATSRDGSNVKGAIDEDPANGWTFRPSNSVREAQAVFVPAEPFGFPGGTRIRIRLEHLSHDPQQTIGRFRLSVTSAKDPRAGIEIPAAIQDILALSQGKRTQAQADSLNTYYLGIAPVLDPIRERLGRLRSLWKDLSSPSTFVMKELPEPRATHVLVRGSYLSKGKQVVPGVPAIFNPLPKDAAASRLSLARWLASPDNPLTARVTVNRLWMEHFGKGIVETVEDFGTRGDRPSHPELLDWLATELVRQKWSLKAMHRLIVTSAAYRQSSLVAPETLRKDPADRLLTRFPRQRLDAELIRDNALSIAGLLNSMLGGPSVFPFQPEGIWNLVYNNDKWRLSEREDRYRRGLYTFLRRTAPYPSFTTFDTPSRETICTRRTATDTPLQALDTLNDPVFFDAARGLARRILIEGPPGDSERMSYAFRLCTARAPDQNELNRLVGMYRQEIRRLQIDGKSAKEIALGGDVAAPPGTDEATFAAWTIVSNVLLNLDETLTKD